MAKQDFIPRQLDGLRTWATDYSKNLVTHQAALGLTDDEVKKQQDFCKKLIDEIDANNAAQKAAQGARKKMDAQKAQSLEAIRKQVKNIKTRDGYTDTIGEALGIIGDEHVVDPTQLKPAISGSQTPQGIHIKWQKGDADALDIYVDRKDGKGFVFLARDTEPDYVDTVAIKEEGVKSAVWDYYALYVISDEQVGKASDTISVTVTRK